MATIQSTQSPYSTDQKKKNEQLHNAATPNILPIQREPLQPVQMVKQPPNMAVATQQPPVPAPPQPQQPVTQQQLIQQGSQMVGQSTQQTPLQQQYTQKAGQFLHDPNLGKNYESEVQRGLREYDIDRAKAVEAAREQVAPFLQSGRVRKDFTDDIIQKAMDRSRLEGQLRTTYDTQQRQNLMDALSAAHAATAEERLKFGTGIDAITKIIQAGEGGEQRKFLESQNALDRVHDIALQTESIGAQKEIENIRADLARGLQVNEQSFKRVENALNRDLQVKLQSDDINSRREALQAQLDFDKWKSEAGFELTREENAANRALEITLQTGDQEFQERMIKFKEKSAMDMLITSKEYDAIQGDLDREIQRADINSRYELLRLKQEFEGFQSEEDRKHSKNMQLAQFDHEKWIQDRVEVMTKAGWAHDTAIQKSTEAHSLLLKKMDHGIQLQIENGRLDIEERRLAQDAQQFTDEMSYKRWATQKGIDAAAADRAWQAKENARKRVHMSYESGLDRQLDREIEAGRISIEEKRLVQDAYQFNRREDFDRWALSEKLDNETANRIWQSKENSLDRATDMAMQLVEIDFSEKGMNLQGVMSQLESENIHPSQAAEMINNMAIEAGITYIDTDGSVKAGLKPVAKDVLEKKQIEDQSDDIIDKLQMGEGVTPDEYDIINQSETIQSVPEMFSHTMVEKTQDARDSRVGWRAYRFTPEAWEWVNENKGNVFKAEDGELYRVENFWEPGTSRNDKNKTAFVTLKSLKDGKTFKWWGGSVSRSKGA